MFIREKEAHCKKCQATILNVPLYMSNFHINVGTDWSGYREETLTGDLQWNCPMCNHTNIEDVRLLLSEEAYISVIVNRCDGYSREEVKYN
jgi:hypothetical protein